jgi:hypothetical protein
MSCLTHRFVLHPFYILFPSCSSYFFYCLSLYISDFMRGRCGPYQLEVMSTKQMRQEKMVKSPKAEKRNILFRPKAYKRLRRIRPNSYRIQSHIRLVINEHGKDMAISKYMPFFTVISSQYLTKYPKNKLIKS